MKTSALWAVAWLILSTVCIVAGMVLSADRTYATALTGLGIACFANHRVSLKEYKDQSK